MLKPLVLAIALITLLASGTQALAAYNIVDGEGFGDCDGMQIINSPSTAIVVEGLKGENGMIDGAIIWRCGRLNLSWMSQGVILVEPGGSLHIERTAHGIQRNRGTVAIDGAVSWLSASYCVVRRPGCLGRWCAIANLRMNADCTHDLAKRFVRNHAVS